MVKYNKLENETTSLIDSQISSLVDKHFKGISDLFEEQETPVSDRVKALFELNEVSAALKCLIEYEHKKKPNVGANGHHVSPKELESIKNLSNIIKFFNEEERKYLNDILKQYGKKIKDQDPKSISVFEAIKIFFQEIIAKFKSKNIEAFNDKHTVKVGNATFYDGNPIQKESKQEIHEPDREITYPEDVLEENEEQISHKEISIPITQIAQEEVVPATKQLVKPLVQKKSQKVIDAGNKIRGSQKTETPSYTSSCTINLKPAGEKPKIAPTVKIDTQTKKQCVQNVASRVQYCESFTGNSNSKTKVKSKVEVLKEKHERFIELASRPSIEQVVSGRSR